MKTYREISSPLGNLYCLATSNGITCVSFDSLGDEAYHSDLEAEKHLDLLATELEAYFQQALSTFSVTLAMEGTAFQKKVWNALLAIPYGATRTYMEQSKVLGDPKAIRAVANANGQNKIAIVIPCHRVIGTDGSLTGYAGKLWRKKFLLELESQQQSLF